MDSLNSPENCRRFDVKKDILEVCRALKKYYLKLYEAQLPIKAPANVDIIHKFFNTVCTQMDVCSIERKEFFEKQVSYKPIPYSEIFVKEKSVVLISGIAGIGKTWLLKKCLLDWSNNLIWKNVALVFYLECRRLNQHQNVSNVNELINVFYYDIINNFNISYHTALFLIDGLDEFKYLNELLNPSVSCKYPIVNALKEIQKYKHVVAGRVNAIDQYQRISKEHSDKLTIQIMGFNENEINNFVESNVKEEKKKDVKATLKESPIAKAMASVPFHLSYMCKIISDSKNIYTSSFSTITDLYANIFLYFLQRQVINNNKLLYEMMEENFNKKSILNICKIAYELFVQNKVIFSKEEIKNFISDFDKYNLFGFIEKIETDLGCHYQFVHLTMMEFCASVYAYNCLSNNEITANEKLKSCLSIICGLTNKSQNSLLRFLVNLNPLKRSFIESLPWFSNFGNWFLNKKVVDCTKSKWILDHLSESISLLRSDDYNLFYECFYESQSSFTDEILLIIDKQKLWSIKIGDGKTSYETSCDNYFINHYIKSGRKLSSLSVFKDVLSDDEKKLLIQCSTFVHGVDFYRPIKLDRWTPKNKIHELGIWISDYLITKKDFEENFLPWIHLCEGLILFLHNGIDFIEHVYEWIRCLNIKWFRIRYRGKDFYNLDELKIFITL
ncbi:NLR family CARD domain-containing protein 4 isoform X2 [Hydra vulgaris]|uniref:NLR family CARD domain-containing protein 4 isoform X2 n=1 Tax=Hydra vulgaris TaxID=6087 RepID=UPI001F5F4159|nr:NLR family CARD domain-containing protein 4 isoform X2 [Hydra vulgaris]